jgi:hypothetical protein
MSGVLGRRLRSIAKYITASAVVVPTSGYSLWYAVIANEKQRTLAKEITFAMPDILNGGALRCVHTN